MVNCERKRMENYIEYIEDVIIKNSKSRLILICIYFNNNNNKNSYFYLLFYNQSLKI